MFWLAMIHLFWLTLTPVGGAFWLVRRRLPDGADQIAAMAALTGLLGWIFLVIIWPFDFVLEPRPRAVRAASEAFGFDLVQVPDPHGFYQTTLRVRRVADGAERTLLVEEDDLKLWWPRVGAEAGVVTFDRLGGGWFAPLVRIDLRAGAIELPGKARRVTLEALFAAEDAPLAADVEPVRPTV